MWGTTLLLSGLTEYSIQGDADQLLQPLFAPAAAGAVANPNILPDYGGGMRRVLSLETQAWNKNEVGRFLETAKDGPCLRLIRYSFV